MKIAIIGCGEPGAFHARIAAQSGHDIVAIASPVSSRTEHVLSAINAGKHVFCEAPLARSVAEATRILDAAQSANTKVFVGHTTRYSRPYRTLAAQIESGAIGTPGFVKTYRGDVFAPGKDIIFDLLIHDFDWLASMLGPPTSIFCHCLGPQEGRSIDYAAATLTFASGVIAQTIGTRARTSGSRYAVEIVGDAGLARYDSDETPVQVTRYSDAFTDTSNPLLDDPHQHEWDDFIAYVENGTEPKATLNGAVEAVRMAEAALRSIETSAPQTVDR
ncbi:MAG: Gfo/Idh/MocA family oxidoreductase [Candidatus Hydrogenedentes bacterium]|nr:Gfo/Idh/MocA family oxidoreductase [Candidatus Hydrogenedentota bacterium]